VEDRITGRLVQPADPVALAEAMLDLLEHPDHARRMAVDAQERVRRLYGAKAWADRLERIYTAAAGAA
jgi:glycosyltransferase involved in cell wall biosynthesis